MDHQNPENQDSRPVVLDAADAVCQSSAIMEQNPEKKESQESQDSGPVVLNATDVEEGYSHMNLATRKSNTFPIGASHNMFQTYPDFNAITAKLRSNVLSLSYCIINPELPTKKLRLDDNESNTDTAIEAIDALHDRINVNLDTMSGVNQPAAGSSVIITQITTVTTSQVVLMASKNVPRPQIMFEDTIENSEHPFVPKLVTKHNAIVPLNPVKLYNVAGNFIGYAHPYGPELSVYEPPEWALRAEDQVSTPAPLEQTPLTLVTTTAQLNDLVEHLRTVRELAVDVEHHAYRTYLGLTCLIQISTDEGGDFIVDALELRRELHVLNEIFTDPNKIKVFHGADQDMKWLQRDLGVYVVGLFDTHQAARLLQFPGLGLKHLLAYYCNLQLDKQFQTADWRIRPLPDELLLYARADTHYLLYAWRRLRADLLARQPPLLRAAFCASNVVATTLYEKPRASDEMEQFYSRSHRRLTCAQLEALRALWSWRDAHARALDESPAYLMPHHQLLALAAAGPRDAAGARALLQPPSPFLRDQQHIQEICDIIRQSAQSGARVQAEAARPVQMPPPMPPRNSIEHDHAYLSSFRETEPQPGCSSWVERPPWRPGPSGQAWVPLRSFMVPGTAQPAPVPAPHRNQAPRNRRAEVESLFLPPYERYRAYCRLADRDRAPAPPRPVAVAVAPDSC